MGAVFVLHGSYESPEGQYGLGFEPFADERGFIVVYPTMSDPKGANWAYTDDLPYMAALVEVLTKDFSVDPALIFACGHSSGGSMSLFLQNEAKFLTAVGAVEAGVGHMDEWHMDERGIRTMVVWNHGDPVLAEFGGEELYRSTISTLRRRGTQQPYARDALPTSDRIVKAELQKYAEDAAPPLVMLSFRSEPGTHAWLRHPNCTFDSTEQLVRFFFDWPAQAWVI
uniref:Peptidase S9 prolyl oligopeptidase catalytic domain-containing protein n=1 Tax=Alexandrium catenella TaxID=2925 RepID=A0A7S1PJW1_ALECA